MAGRVPAVVDLFSGAGGLSLGFHAAGCTVLAAVDRDEAAGVTYQKNFQQLQPEAPPTVLAGDDGSIEEIDLEALTRGVRPDILVGGPPCQGFSLLGRAKLDSLSEEGFAGDPRNELYRRFLDAAELWRPSVVLMENVPGMLSVKGRNVADEAASELEAAGYSVGYAVLNAVWYGVPQYRERLFFVGMRKDLAIAPSMPPATHRAELPSGYQQPRSSWNLPLAFIKHYELPVDLGVANLPATTVESAVADLARLTDHLSDDVPRASGDFRKETAYRGEAHSPFARLMRAWPGLRSSPVVLDHVIRRTPRDYETFKRMKQGDRYPAAMKIARERLEEALGLLREGKGAPQPGSPEFRELERRFVPPYREEIFPDKWRKLVPGEPSWTIPAHLSKDSYSHIHYDGEQARAISVREAARLQSFPDAFAFWGNMGDCFRQVGNAVPPLLSWAIAAHILRALRWDVAPRLPPWNACSMA